MNILETFFILFDTDAKRAAAEVEGSQAAMVAATEAGAAKMSAADTLKTAKMAGNAAKVAAAQAIVAESELGVEGAVVHRAAAEEAQAVARVAEARAIIAANSETAASELATAEAVEKLSKGMGSLIGKATGFIAAGLGLVGILGEIKEAISDINAQTEQADRLGFGMNVEGLFAVNAVLEDYGGNADKAQRNLRSFADSVANAFGDAKSAAAKALAGIGVSVADANGDLKDTQQVMLDLAGALEGVGKAKQMATLNDLGLKDPALKEMLLGGRQNLVDRFNIENAKGIVTNEQAERVRAYKMAWDDVKDAINGFWNSLVGNWAPALTRFADRLTNFVFWMREHSAFIRGIGLASAAVITVIAGALWGSLIPALAATAIGWIVAFAPVIAIGAAVTALIGLFALLYDDVVNFFAGNESMLGELVEKYDWLGDVIAGLSTAWAFLSVAGREAFAGIAAVVSPLIDLLAALARLAGEGLSFVFKALAPLAQASLAVLGPLLKTLGGLFAVLATGISSVFDTAIKTIVAGIRGLITLIDGATKSLNQLSKNAPAVLSNIAPPAVRAGMAAGGAMLQRAASSPLNAQPNSAVGRSAAGASNKTNNIKIDKVEVNTQATDAEGMAKAAGGALSSHLRRATSQYSDGVDR